MSVLDKKEVSLSSEDLRGLVNRSFNDFKHKIIKPKKLDAITLATILQNCMLAAFNSADEDLNLFWRSRADSYTTMAFLKKTPNVKSICKKLVSGDVIIDTCILLPLIAETNSCDERKIYLKIINKAQNNGMKFSATTYAVAEILSHMERCIAFKNFTLGNESASWIGDVPLLYSAFVENNCYDLNFDEWITSIRGNVDYANNIKNFLEEELGISVVNIASNGNVAFKSDLDGIWEQVHRSRRIKRGLPVAEETIEKLAKGDSDTYEYVFEQRY